LSRKSDTPFFGAPLTWVIHAWAQVFDHSTEWSSS
jgi:hypothetical protein